MSLGSMSKIVPVSEASRSMSILKPIFAPFTGFPKNFSPTLAALPPIVRSRSYPFSVVVTAFLPK